MIMKIQPWTVPNFVQVQMPPRTRDEGRVELAQLCDQFRARKAKS